MCLQRIEGLSPIVPKGMEGVYNQAAYLEHRRRMMQWYSDYLDALARGISEEEQEAFKARVERQ